MLSPFAGATDMLRAQQSDLGMACVFSGEWLLHVVICSRLLRGVLALQLAAVLLPCIQGHTASVCQMPHGAGLLTLVIHDQVANLCIFTRLAAIAAFLHAYTGENNSCWSWAEQLPCNSHAPGCHHRTANGDHFSDLSV